MNEQLPCFNSPENIEGPIPSRFKEQVEKSEEKVTFEGVATLLCLELCYPDATVTKAINDVLASLSRENDNSESS